MFLGAEIEPRSQAVAEEDLKDLSAAQKGQIRTMALDGSKRFIALNDVGALPLKTANGKAAYRLWLTLRTPRAFAIADEDGWSYTFGTPKLIRASRRTLLCARSSDVRKNMAHAASFTR